MVRISAETQTILTEVSCGIPQFFKTKPGGYLKLHNDRFLPRLLGSLYEMYAKTLMTEKEKLQFRGGYVKSLAQANLQPVLRRHSFL
jgi:hypothetical protein